MECGCPRGEGIKKQSYTQVSTYGGMQKKSKRKTRWSSHIGVFKVNVMARAAFGQQTFLLFSLWNNETFIIFMNKICVTLNEGQGQHNEHMMHSHAWGSRCAKLDDDNFQWIVSEESPARDRHTHTERLGVVYVNFVKQKLPPPTGPGCGCDPFLGWTLCFPDWSEVCPPFPPAPRN